MHSKGSSSDYALATTDIQKRGTIPLSEFEKTRDRRTLASPCEGVSIKEGAAQPRIVHIQTSVVLV